MERAELPPETRGTWVLANPWLWMTAGFTAVLIGWALLHLIDVDGGIVRFLLVGLGLLLAGVALTVRLSSAEPAHVQRLAPPYHRLILGALTAFHVVLALGVTLALFLSFFGVEAIAWRPGPLVLLWFVVVPMSATAASVCSRRLSRGDFTRGEEASALLVTTAVTCFLAGFAAYNPDDPGEAETFRILFAAMTLVALVAAPLVVVPQSMRRAVVSGLIALHFGGMFTAALAAPPAPWIISQLWVRIYRPYLEFVYLNNAYHFYAPDPGPASYVWFRLIYEEPQKKGNLYHWVKIPDLDDEGHSRHPLALEYQRTLALTENAIQGEAAPTFLLPNGDPMPFYQRRLLATPGPTRAGIWQPKFTAPFLLGTPIERQYALPTRQVKTILASFARHVAATEHPDRPDARVKSVKIYKVTHALPYPPVVFLGDAVTPPADVREPEWYRPHFLGEYDPQGRLVDDEDPFLYWLLPNVREYEPRSATEYWVKSYARQHAGDPDWIYLPKEKQWTNGR